jgi:DNA (cytosine-5)-methyltransferase 1
MGWENKFHCEWNPFGKKVLNYYWPNAESFDDITKTNFTKYAGTIDIISGGFPCQPYSNAGKRLGKEDSRHLWPEMLRAIREIQPRWVVGENVRGLTNWNEGMVFDEVQADLEAIGYEVLPFLLPAAAVNAPHRRDRIWFVAYSNGIGRIQTERWRNREPIKLDEISETRITSDSNHNGLNECDSKYEINASERGVNAQRNIDESYGNGNASDSENIGREDALENGKLEGRRFRQSYKRNIWNSFPSVSPICNGDDGLSSRLDSITFPKWRNESIKAGGNAIVPQVAFQIFKSIEVYEKACEI